MIMKKSRKERGIKMSVEEKQKIAVSGGGIITNTPINSRD